MRCVELKHIQFINDISAYDVYLDYFACLLQQLGAVRVFSYICSCLQAQECKFLIVPDPGGLQDVIQVGYDSARIGARHGLGMQRPNEDNRSDGNSHRNQTY
jgi:hypothetical protein